MPLELPNLDDRNYADLVEEGRRLIPGYAPAWTDHNPSDPGITLLELFAFLSEILIYRLNRVTDENQLQFLKLINGPDWKPSPGKSVTEEIRETVLALRRPSRAVTCNDYEQLTFEADPAVARARCLPPVPATPAEVTVIIVPEEEGSSPRPSGALTQRVREVLEPKRLLTTVLRVVGPRYVTVGVRLTLVLMPDALSEMVRQRAIDALQQLFHPLTGGPERSGWPFGRNVYVSEIYALLDLLPGVDYVRKTINPATSKLLDELIVAEAGRLIRNEGGELTAVEIGPDELVDLQIVPEEIQVEPPEKTET